MRKKTKLLIISIFIIIAIILIVFLAIYFKYKIGINVSTIVSIDNNGKIYTANYEAQNESFNLNEVILKDLNLNEIEILKVHVGEYIYLYIKKDNKYNYCNSTNFYCKVTKIDNNKIEVEMPNWNFYSLDAKKAKIKDMEGKNIDISSLQSGNTIEIINVEPEITPSIARNFEGYWLDHIYDVKKIKLIETDEKTKEKIENRNMVAVKKAIVAGVNKDSLFVVDNENDELLYELSFTNEGNIGFKQGQEILIYFNGKNSGLTGINGINKINTASKIEITGNENKTVVTNEILKKLYTTFDNVKVNIDNITNTEITMTITDSNDIKYDFANKYTLSKNIAKKTQSAVITEEGMSIPGYTGDEWEELGKISNQNSENEGTMEIIDSNTSKRTYNWTDTYGNLPSGEYRLLLEDGEKFEKLSVKFTIDEKGKISEYDVSKGY